MRNFLCVVVSSLLIHVVNTLVSTNTNNNNHDAVLSKVRHAMQLSTLSSSNITAAQEAVKSWKDILIHAPRLDNNVVALCRALSASCLVRVGKDEDAIDAYDLALELKEWLDANTQQDLVLGKAQALQRLLRYNEAKHQYLQSSSERGAVGAATCALRLGETGSALEILSELCKKKGDEGIISSAKGMWGTLQYLEAGTSDPALDSLQSADNLPLYRWIYSTLSRSSLVPPDIISGVPDQDNFRDLIKINQCPFDDASLVLLDDKVNLHKLLMRDRSKTSSFWPEGVIAPNDIDNLRQLIENDTDSLWISKQRAGYGSHGNIILSAQEIPVLNVQEQECLIQRMVEPTLLLDSRKFSLRIYVVYFSPDEVYLSSQGLVKLASEPLTDPQSRDSRVHMTNSGREAAMTQKDLVYLKAELGKQGFSYEDFWGDLRSATQQTIHAHTERRTAEKVSTLTWDARRREMSIPKIMGFDFVVGGDCKPWLVEVNRFPGLEPRDESDRTVKHRVVQDAWICAGARMGLDPHPLQDMLNSLDVGSRPSSLERI
jgi:hypothetical protein